MATVGSAYVVELDAFMTILNVDGKALTKVDISVAASRAV